MDPRHEGYVPELAERFEEMYGYDPERAKELLAEAGYPENFANPVVPIILTALGGNPEFGTMAELFQVFFEAIGLQTEMREMDWATLARSGRPAGLCGQPDPQRPDPPDRGRHRQLLHHPRHALRRARGRHHRGPRRRAAERDRPGRAQRIAAGGLDLSLRHLCRHPARRLHFELSVDPTVVADWTFPGVTTNSVSHYHLIEAAR
jgi:peptide/nickel transport system substrate-binding protein